MCGLSSVPECWQDSHSVQSLVTVCKCARVSSSVSQSVMEMGQRHGIHFARYQGQNQKFYICHEITSSSKEEHEK